MDIGRKKERQIANYLKKLNNKVKLTGSGAGKFLKGDIHLNDSYLVEVKTTGNQSFAVKYDLLKKIKGEALRSGKKPVLIIDIKGERWACVPLDEFAELIKNDGDK